MEAENITKVAAFKKFSSPKLLKHATPFLCQWFLTFS